MAHFQPLQSHTQGKRVWAAQIGTALGVFIFSAGCSPETPDEPPGPLGTAELLDVHQAEGLLVAVGTNDPGREAHDLESYIISSTDGINWEEGYRAPGSILNSVAYGADRWVTAGWGFDENDEESAEIFASEDGLVWELQPALAVEHLMDVVWTGEAFVLAAGRGAFGVDEIVVFTSTDGVEWIEGPSLPGGIDSRLAESQGTVLLYGSDVSVSQDHGATWSSVTGLTEETWVNAVYADGTEFRGISVLDCCFGEVADEIENFEITSDDGLVWTETPMDRSSFRPRGVVASRTVEVGFDWTGVRYRELGGQWKSGTEGFFEDVIYAGDIFVAVGAWDLKWSRDGKEWKDGTLLKD